MPRLMFALCLAASLAAARPALAAPGDLDPSFGSGGIVLTDVLAASDGLRDGLVLPDGRIVVCGIASASGSSSSFLLARYLVNGNLDPSFGSGGIVTTSFSGTSTEADAIVRQPDGKLVLAGTFRSGSSGFTAVARYDSNGVLDPGFGTGGRVSTLVGLTAAISDALVQPDGRIVICGTFLVSGTTTFLGMRRFLASGVVDSTFGINGTVTRGPGVANQGAAITLQSDNKIVAAGTTQLTSGSFTALLTFRFKPNGSPDSTFGFVGRAITPLSPMHHSTGQGIHVLANGSILTGGTQGSVAELTHRFGVARFTPAGVLDSTFATNGIALTPEIGLTTGGGFMEDMLVASDGRILLGGMGTNIGTSDDFAVARMLSTGAMDGTFGSGGVVTTDLAGGGRDFVYKVLLQTDGRVVALGQGGTGVLPGGAQASLVRYLGDAPLADVPADRVGAPLLALAPNAPNPFRASTEIAFRLARRARVELTVYDVMGRACATLLAEEQAAGVHRVTWDGRDPRRGAARSGLYFARLTAVPADGAPPETATVRMSLLR